MTHEKGTCVPSHMLCLNIEHYVLLGTGHIRKDLSLPTVHCKSWRLLARKFKRLTWWQKCCVLWALGQAAHKHDVHSSWMPFLVRQKKWLWPLTYQVPCSMVAPILSQSGLFSHQDWGCVGSQVSLPHFLLSSSGHLRIRRPRHSFVRRDGQLPPHSQLCF